jgi:hypothetical protein
LEAAALEEVAAGGGLEDMVPPARVEAMGKMAGMLAGGVNMVAQNSREGDVGGRRQRVESAGGRLGPPEGWTWEESQREWRPNDEL